MANNDPTLDQAIGLPVRRRPQGYFAPMRGTDLTRTAFAMILGTRIGERVMRPALGSRVPDLLFEPNDAVLQNSAKAFIEDALNEQQSRATLVSSAISTERDALLMTLTYQENRETPSGVERLDLSFNRR